MNTSIQVTLESSLRITGGRLLLFPRQMSTMLPSAQTFLKTKNQVFKSF